MTEYMKEVLDWMFGEKHSIEVKHRRDKSIALDRCAPYITDNDIEEAREYIGKNCSVFQGMSFDGYVKYQVYPARKKVNKKAQKK